MDENICKRRKKFRIEVKKNRNSKKRNYKKAGGNIINMFSTKVFNKKEGGKDQISKIPIKVKFILILLW